MLRREDEKEVGNIEAPPGLEKNSERNKPLVLETPRVPSTMDTLKDAGDKNVVTQVDSVSREVGAGENASEDREEAEKNQPASPESSAVNPDSPPLPIQLPSTPSPFGKNCAPTKAPTLGPRFLDHLS